MGRCRSGSWGIDSEKSLIERVLEKINKIENF
jgi:hypothetical protein